MITRNKYFFPSFATCIWLECQSFARHLPPRIPTFSCYLFLSPDLLVSVQTSLLQLIKWLPGIMCITHLCSEIHYNESPCMSVISTCAWCHVGEPTWHKWEVSRICIMTFVFSHQSLYLLVRAACVRCHWTKCPLFSSSLFSLLGLLFSQKGLL